MNRNSDPPIRILARERLHDGFYPIDRLTVQCRRFDGSWSQPMVREQYGRENPVIALIVYDPRRELTLLVEQCRIGPLAYVQDERAWLLEPIAGHADEGETLEAACIREAAEEARLHLTPAALKRIGMFYPTPGGGRERIFLFEAACDLSDTADYGGAEEEGEDIRLHVLSFDTVAHMLESGRFNVATTLIGMQWLIWYRWPQLRKGEGR